MDKYIIYADGAATIKQINGEYIREAGGWGYVILHNNKVILSAYGGENRTTNNAMELQAILNAIQKFNTFGYNGKEIEICSDSAYCVNIFTSWINGWKANGWTRGKKHESIENIDIIKEIDKAISETTRRFNKISFIKVRGHAGDKWNEYVDKLAVRGKTEMACHGIKVECHGEELKF